MFGMASSLGRGGSRELRGLLQWSRYAIRRP